MRAKVNRLLYIFVKEFDLPKCCFVNSNVKKSVEDQPVSTTMQNLIQLCVYVSIEIVYNSNFKSKHVNYVCLFVVERVYLVF